MPLENDVTRFFEFLNHDGLGYTELRNFSQDSRPAHRLFTKKVAEFEIFCERYSGQEHVYAGVNPRPKKEGTNESIEKVTDIVLDVEYDHPKNTMISIEQLEYTLESIEKIFKDYQYDNIFAVMTGNGVQIHFKINPTVKSDKLQKAHRRYVEYFRSVLPENIRIDNLCDYARIVRVPGTFNIKGGNLRQAYIWKNGTGRSAVFLNKFTEFYNSVTKEDTKVDVVVQNESMDKMIALLNKYPCYSSLYSTPAQEGEHHHTAVRLIAFLRNEGFNNDEIFSLLDIWDKLNGQYEGSKMIQSLIWKQEKKLYNFGCKDSLLAKYCKFDTCAMKQKEDQFVPLVNMATEAENYLEATASKPPETAPELTTGFPQLDQRMWGLRKGELTVIAAYTSVGKTAAACQIAANNAKKHKKVLYISSESKFTEIYNRMLAETFNIDSFHFRNNWFTQDERDKLKNAKDVAKDWTLWICDEPMPTRTQVETAIKQTHPDIVILDYIQRCDVGKDYDERQGLKEWMQHMKTIASRYNCASVVLSQLRRRQENESDPNLWDLFGSGSLEMEGDNVILLHSKPAREQVGFEEVRTVKWILAKGRNIGIGKFLFQYIGKYARFQEVMDTGEMIAESQVVTA